MAQNFFQLGNPFTANLEQKIFDTEVHSWPATSKDMVFILQGNRKYVIIAEGLCGFSNCSWFTWFCGISSCANFVVSKVFWATCGRLPSITVVHNLYRGGGEWSFSLLKGMEHVYCFCDAHSNCSWPNLHVHSLKRAHQWKKVAVGLREPVALPPDP